MDVIVLGKFLYPIVSDATCYIANQFKSFTLEDKVVSGKYMEKNNIFQRYKAKRYKIYGVSKDKIAERQDEGWQYIYEIDEKNKKYYRLIIKNSAGNIDIVYMFISEDKQQEPPKNIEHKYLPINTKSSKILNLVAKIKNIFKMQVNLYEPN